MDTGIIHTTGCSNYRPMGGSADSGTDRMDGNCRAGYAAPFGITRTRRALKLKRR